MAALISFNNIYFFLNKEIKHSVEF